MRLKHLTDIPSWQWPEDAVEIIQEALTDRRALKSDRMLAVELAGDPVVIDDELADILMTILKDSHEDEEMRCLAVDSLGPGLEMAFFDGDEDGFMAAMIGYDEEAGLSLPAVDGIQESLCRLYRDADVPETVRRRILEASVREHRNWHRAAVTAAFRSSDEAWRLTAVFCMGYMPEFEEQILESLTDDNAEIVREAVNSAVNQGIDDVLPHIREVLSANSPENEALIFDIIGLVPEVWPEMAYDLIGHLVHDKNTEIAEAALDALTLSQTIMALDEEEFDDEFDDAFDDEVD